MVITRAARRYLLDTRNVAECGLQQFAAMNDVSVHVAGKWLKHEGITWRELYRDELKLRMRCMMYEGYTAAEMCEALGYGKIQTFYRWHRELFGRPYRFKEHE